MSFPEISKLIGQRIKILRLERKISQQDLAAACNIEKSNMARIGAGRTNLTVGTLEKICRVLDVPISRLFESKE